MITIPASSPRVALVRNYTTDGQWGQDMLDRICDLVHASAPDANIVHYHPIDGGEVPEQSQFDLVILTGGLWDLTQSAHDPWVAKTLDWLRDVAANSPQTKVLGICWGHQAVALALGGKIVFREGGTLIDVGRHPPDHSRARVLPGHESLAIHKFHKRVVAERPKGFQALGETEEIFLSDSGQFLTFQGHPELTPRIAQEIFKAGGPSYLSDSSPEGVARLYKKLERPDDGARVFAVAMDWALGASRQ